MAAKREKSGRDRKGGIVIRKEEVVEGGHHGGAWKVAYADFVTAMMAFFLLMWLLNATTEEQRKGLADYFSPLNVLGHNATGNGRPFGGHTPFDQGAMVSDRGAAKVLVGNSPPAPPDAEEEDGDQQAQSRVNRRDTPNPDLDPDEDSAIPGRDGNSAVKGVATRGASGVQRLGMQQAGLAKSGDLQAGGAASGDAHGGEAARGEASPGEARAREAAPGNATAVNEAAFKAEMERREKAEFNRAAEQIREAVRADPALADLGKQLAIDMTPQGLRVQLLDADKVPMFPSGSSALSDRARALLQKVAPVLQRLPESISIAGHTDATPYRGVDKTNWELSTERANATRRLLVESGVGDARIRTVTGNADRDPLLPADPFAAANRRIAIVVLSGTRAAAIP